MNVRIYSIGAGSIEGAPIPVEGRGFKRKDNGEVVVSKLIPGMLKGMAEQSGGEFYESSNRGYRLNEVYRKINQDIEKVLISKTSKTNLLIDTNIHWRLGY